MGEGEARERAIVGEAPNLAARLQALAEPGTVLIAESTRRLTGGLFDYEDLGAVEIKGFGAPVIAAGVLRESEVEGRFAALRTPGTPLIGRDEELALLQRRWQQAKGGEGRVSSARPITKILRSTRRSRTSNGRRHSGAKIAPRNGSKSWRPCSGRQLLTSARLYH